MTRDEETRQWIKTHLRQIERPEEVDDYLRAYRYLDSRRDEITQDAEIEVHGGVGWLRRGTSVIAVPDDWHDGDKVTVRISKINENDNENENRLKMKLKNEKEALQKFCSDDDFREKLKYPFINEKDNGRLTATDAHIMLMVDTSLLRCKYKSQEVTVPNVESENCNRIVRFADIDAAYNRFKLVPEMVAKDGGTDECPECDGTGTVEYEYTDNEGRTHYHEEDCPICEGDGKRDVEMVPTGRMLLPEKSLFRIDGVTFEARELWKAVEGLRLMGFEQMTWQTAKENKANRFDVCEGITFLIMPFHYCGDEKGVVTEEIKDS